MTQWTFAEVRLTPRVSIKIEFECGGVMKPIDVIRTGQLLQWIGKSTQKWRHHFNDAPASPPATGEPSA